MYMSHIRPVLFTLVALYSIATLLDNNTVVCVPVTGASAHQNGTFNSTVDDDTFHNFTNISPETIKGLKDSQDLITEGDIFVQSDRNARDRIWPGVGGHVTLPYVITPELAPKTREILSAMKMISDKCCVTFHEREDEDHYINFSAASGCASYIGFIGGKQEVAVAPHCTVGNICHELLHTLGFYHEHSRMDRDSHVKIEFQNIVKGEEKNFKKVDANTLDLPYDLDSITHYGSLFFSSNGQPTLVPKNSVQDLGQRSHLSELDVQRLRKLYKCE
ncbi:astacin-like metalloendopeptidase [Clupea harengus]|uniref:Metalloendopeptidase n=1 Tax=Clupea harengus TaxID=7950 RepID=A0A6P3VEM0_CLUHA|nr:astacin-like metalloendopeptidase [Clupea harengus]